MSEVKQVKVDNWGIYFLQRLKHFFNRTDYCDLTLQFQDNAQLKVHRLVLSACTEYFELLERTCEMYEDCLVMPDDLQADVVVPIINFMYTGQLEFKMDLLEKLYQTSLIMNMPVLTKLLASHHCQTPQQSRTAPNSYYGKRYAKQSKATPLPSSSSTNKRSFSNAFENTEVSKPKKVNVLNKPEPQAKNGNQESGSSSPKFPVFSEKNKTFAKEPRPTRYELPAELDEDNIFDNSFTNISYTSKPLMVHPDTTKQYTPKKFKLFEEGSSSRYARSSSNNDIVECKKISSNNSLFIDEPSESVADESDMYQQSLQSKDDPKDANQLFDQIIENDCSNITIETKNNKQSGNLDHAKIISEVLKKYPHLVKSNKHIKLKILNSQCKSKKSRTPILLNEEKESKVKAEAPDFTYETDVLDSKEAARLIALGAENVKGPWICLICGTPGKALHFTSYYNFRKHLVEIHNEKAVPNICEYCGLKSQKRNYLVHHQLTKHGVTPPSHYNFPKCNYCKYIALNEALLVKHKMTHNEVRSFRRNSTFTTAFTSSNVVDHTQKTGNKYGAERKQCIYCLRNFLRDTNLYAHLKTNHKEAARNDGLIDDSDEEIQEEEEKSKPKLNTTDTSNYIKVEVPIHFDTSYDDTNVQYQIERRPDGNIHVVSKKPRVVMPVTKHKILNPGFTMQRQNSPTLSKPQKAKTNLNTTIKRNEYLQELCISPSSNTNNEDIVLIDNTEYIIQDYQLIPKKEKFLGEYLMTNTLSSNKDESVQTVMPTTSLEFHNIQHTNPDAKVFVKKTTANQPIQIVVSNEEEYKALVSNQSVIFEDADTNKSLAVLAQESSPLETATIDLDNTQSNDMMIIQDNYSINVSEAVANNSNIVVVYSHPVEDQNKQYQIITTQEVEAEFVSSSPIITQNYETVTTCSPIVTHTTVDNSWQSNIQTHINKLPMTTTSELHTMTVAESVTIAPEPEPNTNVNEYQDVSLLTPEAVPVINMDQIVESQIQTTENNFHESNIITNITEVINDVPICQQTSTSAIEQPTVITSHQHTINETHMQPMSVANLDQPIIMNTLIPTPPITKAEQSIEAATLNTLPENVEEIPQNENENPVFVEEILQQQNNSTNPLPIADNQSVIKSLIGTNICAESENVISDIHSITQQTQDEHITEPQQPTAIVPDAVVEVPEELEQPIHEIVKGDIIDSSIEEIGINQNTIEVAPELPKIIEKSEVDPVSKVDPVAIAQIENLTSEWSEDENETVLQEVVKADMIDSEIKNNDAEETSEVEESIENIQQEMRKHISVEALSYPKEDGVNLTQDNTLTKIDEPQESTEVSNSGQTSQEKISSLLNDWDDNDSQEDVPAANESKGNDKDSDVPKPQNENIIEERQSVLVDKNEIIKNDKIKSLVSDWDEDEEECKG